jgi:hypothetical protein
MERIGSHEGELVGGLGGISHSVNYAILAWFSPTEMASFVRRVILA